MAGKDQGPLLPTLTQCYFRLLFLKQLCFSRSLSAMLIFIQEQMMRLPSRCYTTPHHYEENLSKPSGVEEHSGAHPCNWITSSSLDPEVPWGHPPLATHFPPAGPGEKPNFPQLDLARRTPGFFCADAQQEPVLHRGRDNSSCMETAAN